jgi:predicted NBD/HSP70 family sugar kinase
VKRINLKKASVARADTIRTINRQIVLNYVRERSPISRAEIAHETDLQRSTISLIVEELKADGLVEEIEGESTGGRPPLLLRLRASDAVAVGVDVGTARTIVGTSDLAGRLLERDEFETDPDPDETLDRVISHVTRLIRKDRDTVEGVGISLPGLVDFETGSALFIPHHKWRHWAVGRGVSEATGLPVIVDNDANAVALAELWFGRPEVREVRDFIMVLVESGLGTGVVFDGQVYRGESGAAGEFGHMTIGRDAPVSCATGSRTCWESFASERAALARYGSTVGGPEASRVGFDELIDRALGGEAAARSALAETARYLGVGVANLIKGLSPEAVILGGRIARAWPLIEDELHSSVTENSVCRGLPAPRIFVSSLGEQSRLRGALSLVLAGKFASALPT